MFEREDQLDGFETYVLLSARNCIERVGWTQGARARDPYGDMVSPVLAANVDAYSLVGALEVGIYIHRPSLLYGNQKLLRSKISELLRRVEALATPDMETWNDEPRRQAAHVVDLLEQVAASYGEDQR